MSKANEVLSSVNIFLSTATDRITPNIILCIAMINGFILALATTGYLGEKTISVLSLISLLIVWQFVVMCVFSSKYITLTTTYLGKFFISVLMGYDAQWQLFGMYVAEYEPEKIKYITPIMDNSGSNLILVVFFVMGLKYCFTDNEIKNETKMDMSIQ